MTNPYRPAIILDIETHPDPKILNDADWWAREEASLSAPSNYTDAAKIRKYLIDARAKLRDGMALSPITGKIAMIGIRDIDDGGVTVIREDEDEKRLLEDFAAAIGTYMHPQIVGWYIRKFDAPFIAGRAIIHGVRLPNWFPTTRSYRDLLVDLKEDIVGGGSLDKWQYLTGHGFKTVAGAALLDITLDELEEHLRDDLAATADIARRCEWAWRKTVEPRYADRLDVPAPTAASEMSE